MIAVQIAVVAQLEAVRRKTDESVAVAFRPFAAYEKGGVPAALRNEPRDLFHIFRPFVDVEHQCDFSALRVAFVDGVACGERIRYAAGQREKRGREHRAEYGAYDDVRGDGAESAFFHTVKYVCAPDDMWYNNAMNEMIVFDSGLRLIVSPNPAVRSVAAGVFVGAGSAYETPEQSGISHFIEHMMFKGTANRSAFDIVNEIDSLGAQINAYTTKSSTCYYTLSRDVHAAECLDVLSDMYFNASFDGGELKKERKVVLEELNESEDTPDDLCMEKLSAAFFKGHPLEKPILGTRKSLHAMNAEDLHAYKDKFYVPGGTVISLAGNLTVSEGVRLAERYFEDKFAEAKESPRQPLAAAPMKGMLAHAKKEIEQAHIAFAFPSAAYDTPDAVAARLLAAVFGTEMSSRLFQSVRERLGLCYSIVGYPTAYENNGAFIIYTSTSPENVELAVTAIRKEIDLLLKEGITAEELRKGKEQIVTGMVLGQESTSAVMRGMGRHAVATGKLYDIDEQIAKAEAVTCSDVADVAAGIFDFGRVSASCVSPSPVDVRKMIREA